MRHQIEAQLPNEKTATGFGGGWVTAKGWRLVVLECLAVILIVIILSAFVPIAE